ncbi:class I SAM-dependent methyltransferase [Amycolatopsis anabasis]|uniref:class I SAM-dependent methyltransferase n=1 Tax=Amycolatopsis anabasis TaxID=1840409 RepID=UPI001FE33E3C|nr:class I SAM-dependent methyltransferase [Amycolatopsis anabasis]
MPQGYRYPDPGDRVTASFIGQHEPYPGYWAVSEQRAFAHLGERITEHLGSRGETRALDAGCGDGRLLPWLAGFAAEITATDPDPDRLAAARTTRLPAETRISFQHTPMTGITGGPYDLVLCSHIVQHMPTGDVEPSLRRLRDLAAPGGLLVLSYRRAPVGRGGYTLDRSEGGAIRSEPVDRDRFDEAATTGAREGVLPVRALDPQAFGKEVAATGWTSVWTWTYHVLEDFGVLDRHADRDEVVNAQPALLRDLGRDIVTLWRREP